MVPRIRLASPGAPFPRTPPLPMAGLPRNTLQGMAACAGFPEVRSRHGSPGTLRQVFATSGRMRHADEMPETPVVNCVLLWARPGMEAALSAYEDKVLRLVGEHGGRVLQRGTVLPGSQYDGEPPEEVQFLEMPSEVSLDAYMTDPRRLAMAAERDAAIARTDLFRIQPVSRPGPG